MDDTNSMTNAAFEKNEAVTLFDKDAITNSKKYANCRDFLNGNLEDEKKYSLEEVDEMIKKGGFK